MSHRYRRRLAVATAAIALAAAIALVILAGKPAAASPAQVYRADTGSRVRVNQVGYLPTGPKNATVVTGATQPVAWELKDRDGSAVVVGNTTPRGVDLSSGQNVHTIDFTDYRVAGTGYTLVADGETSLPFAIGTEAYQKLRTDSLSFYYLQRSGIEIVDRAAPGYARAAGHVGVAPNKGDVDVPCQPGACDYTLDVRGGWYDAGDHGKYVVNGGVSVYQLMSLYERSLYERSLYERSLYERNRATALGDGSLRVPEHGNGVPDVLDEARWELDFLLRMQVPPGKPLAGMAHHKVGDAAWTPLPLAPAADPQQRLLGPPSTAATLNLAAAAAQGARLFKRYDAAFADRLRCAARTAWAAALAHPAVYAASSDGVGSGAYDDDSVTDEFYWAAAELYLSTGEKQFADHVLASPWHTADVFRPESFGWKDTAAIGRLELATVPSGLPDRARVRQSVVDGAVRYVATVRAHGYGLPYAPANGKFEWGSNSFALNNMVVMASAFDITGDVKFRDGVLEGIGYILGRNALNQSYVTGHGARASHRQHSRWYANQLDPTLPSPPPGTLAGGPNSSIQDPLAAESLKGCHPQLCYRDDIRSWSTNELTINWNSTLAWVSTFIAS